MASFQEVAIEEILRSELGKAAKFERYDRKPRSPMNLVLDVAEREIGPRFTVYWVDDGPPDVFSLPGLAPSPVVFSTRHLSLTAFARRLFVDIGPVNEDLVDVAERTALRLMAEMALRRGDSDYAVLAFVRSVAGQGIWTASEVEAFLSDKNQVTGLEAEPINEAYMATWFYGLAHELGHLHPHQTQRFAQGDLFSDIWMLDAITAALERFSIYPESMKQQAIERAKQRRSQSVVGIDHVRSEGLADFFATSVLLRTTVDLMKELNREPFEIERFILEMMIFLNIVGTFDRCRRVASFASATDVDKDAAFEASLYPVQCWVRALMQRTYLEPAVAGYLFRTGAPTPPQYARAETLLDEINEGLAETINRIETGIGRAMQFSLYPERRENDWVLLEAFRKHTVDNRLLRIVARGFWNMVDALGVNGKLLRAFKTIVDNPDTPVRPDPIGDILFSVPWVEGPNGFSRPFGLDTKHGHLVFVFLGQNEVFEIFFQVSSKMLKPGFALQKALVPVPRVERLMPELATHMPADTRFQVVVEGTEVFAQYMKELADDTIWDDKRDQTTGH
jgi:hypothetical protein